jgi:glutamate racemase
LSDANSPIGVFDSGIGGLTVLKALGAEIPGETFIYLGDTARLPYGTKTGETVARYSVQAAQKLASFGIKALVVACNTASALGLNAIREKLDGLPVIGVIEPGADAACRVSRSGHIAVIATESTVRGGAYQEAIQRRRSDAKVTARAAQVFVALAEEGMHEGQIAESVAHHYLDSVFDPPGAVPGVSSAPDTLVLGCTHFPMLAGAIRAAVGSGIRVVDSAATTAKVVREQLAGARLLSSSSRTMVRFLATDGAERFARVGTRFLGQTLSPENVELVDL